VRNPLSGVPPEENVSGGGPRQGFLTEIINLIKESSLQGQTPPLGVCVCVREAWGLDHTETWMEAKNLRCIETERQRETETETEMTSRKEELSQLQFLCERDGMDIIPVCSALAFFLLTASV